MENFKSLADAMNDLRNRGYIADFTTEEFCLYCGEQDMRLNPEQFRVDEEYRFEEDPAHDEEVVLVAITSSNGIKGILVDSYESYSVNPHFNMAKTYQNFAGTALA